MSEYLITELLLILFLGLWGMAKHNLSEEEKESERLKSHLETLKESNSCAWDEIRELKEQRKKDLRSAIRYLVLEKTTESNPEELVDIIIDHLWYVGDISTVQDLFEYDFDYIIKVSVSAKDGLLDIYYNYDLYGDNPFLIAADGQHILLSEEEAEKIQNRDYSFLSLSREATKE